MKYLFVIGALLLVLGLYGAPRASAEPAAAVAIEFNLPAGTLGDALNLLSRRAGVTLSYEERLVQGFNVQALQGSYTSEAALLLLLQNTGLQLVPVGDSGWLIRPASTKPDNLVLGAVRVGGGAGSEGIYAHASGVARVNRTDIDRSGPRHASEILQATPGVATITNEQNPAVAVQIRGLKDFGRVNMNIDGMRQNYQRTGHQQRNGEMYFDTEFLSSVEITKGAASGLGGAGTTAGVATFRTLEATDILQDDSKAAGRLRLNSGLGQWRNGQELSGSLALAARASDTIDVVLAYSQRNSDEYEPGKNGDALLYSTNPDYSYTTPATIVNGTSQDMESLLLKASWLVAEEHLFKFTYLASDTVYRESAMQNDSQAYDVWLCKSPPAFYEEFCATFEYDPENVYPLTSSSQVNNKNYALDYEFDSAHPYINVAAKAYFVTTDSQLQSASQGLNVIAQTDTFGGYAKNNAQFHPTQHWKINWDFGVEGFRDTTKPAANSTTMTGQQLADASGVTPEGRRSMVSGFNSVTIDYADWLQLTPGLRYDLYHLWGTARYNGYIRKDTYIVNVDHTFGKWLPTLGIAVKPWAPVQFFANAGLGWRPPAITETLISGSPPGHAIAVPSYPNWTLEPEETRSVEFGVNVNLSGLISDSDRLKIKLLHFNNETENYIFLASAVGLPGEPRPGSFNNMFANALDKVTFKGEEFSLDYDAQHWYVGVEVTRMEREGDLLAPWYPAGGEPPPGTLGPIAAGRTQYFPVPPEYTGAITLGMRLFNQKLDAGVQWRYTDQSGNPGFLELNENVNVAESQVTDLYASWNFGEVRAGINLKNLFDREYIMAQGDSWVRTYAPGRTLTANVQWRF